MKNKYRGDMVIRFEVSCGVGEGNWDENHLSAIVPEWESLSSRAINKLIQQEYEEWKNSMIDGGWKIKD